MVLTLRRCMWTVDCKSTVKTHTRVHTVKIASVHQQTKTSLSFGEFLITCEICQMKTEKHPEHLSVSLNNRTRIPLIESVSWTVCELEIVQAVFISSVV